MEELKYFPYYTRIDHTNEYGQVETYVKSILRYKDVDGKWRESSQVSMEKSLEEKDFLKFLMRHLKYCYIYLCKLENNDLPKIFEGVVSKSQNWDYHLYVAGKENPEPTESKDFLWESILSE